MRLVKPSSHKFRIGLFLLALPITIGGAWAQSESWQLGPFIRPLKTPILSPRPQSVFTDPITKNLVHWESLNTFNPGAIVRHGKVYVIYRAEDASGEMKIGGHTSRLGLAVSDDGVHFTQEPAPILYPAEDSQQGREVLGGTEDPRITEGEDGTYYLTYTQWSPEAQRYDLGLATSKDLHHWTKRGPIFAGVENGKYDSLKYKSGGILTQARDGKLVAAKLNGKYWMYWGEVQIRVASSPDLIHWTPVEGADGQPVVVLKNRPGMFDSSFPEVGPPPLLTDQGIVVFYNGRNSEKEGDSSLSPGVYSVGQALFSAQDPTKLVARSS